MLRVAVQIAGAKILRNDVILLCIHVNSLSESRTNPKNLCVYSIQIYIAYPFQMYLCARIQQFSKHSVTFNELFKLILTP